MGSDDSRRRLNRKTTIETLEERRVMSADPLGGLLGGSLAQDEQAADLSGVPVLELHQTAGFAEQSPDFWLDTTYGSFEEQLDQIEQTLASAHGVTGLTQVRQDYGFVGTGQTVAVIDSGIAWDHYALGGGFGADYRVVGGWDFTEENDANPYDDGPTGSHGTHVAGIVGGNPGGTSADTGVAPGVDLVGLRVFNDAGAGYFSWVENALEWVHQNRNSFENPITVVNLSLGTNWNSDSVPSWAMLEDEFAQLEADGIFIAVSAGNGFTTYNTPGLSYPAASSHVVPVMSVDDSGLLSYYSQRSDRSIAAPGRFIRSTVPDYAGNHNGATDDWASFSGTSMASPYVAGASVLVREAMEFVGYSNITQQTIYDHMIATADRFFDAATNAYYNRLNLANAIDALMPDDDFGSSMVDAYDMGTIGGGSSGLAAATSSMEMAGLIGKLDDADYFTFTAGLSGTVSFTASTSHQLTEVWDTCDCATWSIDGKTLTLNVVAGQTYTVGLSSNSGLGYYDLTIDVQAVFTFTDWGVVTQSLANDVANSGETWYRVEASRTGYLTIEALHAGAAGNLDLALYDANFELVASGVSATDSERVDALASAGQEFYLRVTGTIGDMDFRLTNLVSVSGSTVEVAGTAAADEFTFDAGTTQHTVSVNGVTYQFAAGSIAQINFSGGAGSDRITMTGTSGNETATLRAGDAKLAGNGFTASAVGVENVTVQGGGGYDRAALYDSVGKDVFTAYPDRSVMQGSGFANATWDFDWVVAHATAGGYDTAKFYDSSGNDVFTACSDRAGMQGTGFTNVAKGFEWSVAYAVAGGNDQAVFYDSSGNDVFTAFSDRAGMQGAGYTNVAHGFDRSLAYAIHGGNDQAVFYDSSGDDVFTATPSRAGMEGTGYWNVAAGFDRSLAYAIFGGNDRAVFYDSAGNDVYTATPERAGMQGAGFWNVAAGFDQSIAYSNAGGHDQAVFYDSAGNDVYTALAFRATMQGDGFSNVAAGFGRTVAFATRGGYDRATLDDSSGNDALLAAIWGAQISGDGFANEVRGFDEIAARLVNGGEDATEVTATDYIFNLFGKGN